MKVLVAFFIAVLFCATGAQARVHKAPVHKFHTVLITPTYTLECDSSYATVKRVVLICGAKKTTVSVSHDIFKYFRYGDNLPQAEFTQAAPEGNGGPSVGCADNTITCTYGYNVQLNLGNANTWTATQTFSNVINNGLSANDTCISTNGSKQEVDPASACAQVGANNAFTGNNTFSGTSGFSNFINTTYVPSGACQTGGPTAAICAGSPTSAISIAIGHVTDAWGGTATDNSGGIYFYYGNGSAENHCGFQLTSAAGAIVENGTRSCGFAVNGTLFMQNNNVTGITKLGGGSAACSGTGTFTGQANSGGSQCLVTLSSGAAAWTFATSWSAAPLCIGTDTTSAAAVKITTTTTVATITGTSSDVIAVHCFGNGNT